VLIQYKNIPLFVIPAKRGTKREVESRSNQLFFHGCIFGTFGGKSTAKPPKAHKLAVY